MNTPIIGEPKEETKQTPQGQVEQTEQQTTEEDESIFEGKKHFPIFPTGLFQFELKDEELNEVKETTLPALKRLAPEGKSNWISQPEPEKALELKSLANLFTEATVEVLGFSGVIYDKMQVTTLRVHGVNEPYLFPAESKPNNILVGIFIAKTNDDARLTFLDPRPQAWIIKPPVKEPNIYNSDAFSVDVKENQMFVFPSWLQYTFAFKENVKENLWVTWTAMIAGGGTKKPPTP
jgi:hypothetical protein